MRRIGKTDMVVATPASAKVRFKCTNADCFNHGKGLWGNLFMPPPRTAIAAEKTPFVAECLLKVLSLKK